MNNIKIHQLHPQVRDLQHKTHKQNVLRPCNLVHCILNYPPHCAPHNKPASPLCSPMLTYNIPVNLSLYTHPTHKETLRPWMNCVINLRDVRTVICFLIHKSKQRKTNERKIETRWREDFETHLCKGGACFTCFGFVYFFLFCFGP